jgi:hypothetical protein
MMTTISRGKRAALALLLSVAMIFTFSFTGPLKVYADSSNIKTLASVAGEEVETIGTGTADEPEEVAVDVLYAKDEVGVADFVATDDLATVNIYSNDEFDEDVDEDISLEVGDENHAFVKVTAEDVNEVAYYDVTITRLLEFSSLDVIISGDAKVGQVLTADVESDPDDASFAYQWFVGGDDTPSATTATYTPVVGDVGKTVVVKVIATKAGYSDKVAESDATEAVAAANFTSVTATISGTAKVGQVLTAKAASNPTGATFTYAWFAGGTAIANAITATYTPVAGNVGKTLTVKVTAVKTGYVTKTVESAATAAVAAADAPVVTPKGTQSLKAPKFTSAQKKLATKANTANKKVVKKATKVAKKGKVGSKLTVKAKAIKGFKVTYQWYRGGKVIAKATKSTYKLAKADKGKKITLKVSYTTTKKAKVTDAKYKSAKYKPTKVYTYKLGKVKK